MVRVEEGSNVKAKIIDLGLAKPAGMESRDAQWHHTIVIFSRVKA